MIKLLIGCALFIAAQAVMLLALHMTAWQTLFAGLLMILVVNVDNAIKKL